ncbi:hypothetical protein BGZ47_001917 [Haplosporangium gracile]|nr:hypothetical protein BGZ47_001917 [Haplosporangium gracile]
MLRKRMAKFLSRQIFFSLYTFMSFYKHDKNLLFKSVVQFRRDVWLSDDHIDTFLYPIEGMHRTGSKTRFFVFDLQFLQGFIDAARYDHPSLANWSTNRLEQALELKDYVVANPECDAKAFTVVNTGGHWAVLVFDFRRKQLFFGDSMDKGNLNLNGRQYIIDGTHLLLKSCRSPAGEKVTAAAAVKSDKARRFIRVDGWVKSPARFPVPQQNDSVSCELAALSAIEHSINPSCELWSQRRATFFRVKYLMYSISSMRPATFIMPKPPQPSKPTLTSDKAKENTPQGRTAGEDTAVLFNEKHNAQDDKQSDTGSVPPKSAAEHGSSTTHSIEAAEKTADTSLEKIAEFFIEDTATPSIKEEGSKDKNQQSAGKKVLKTEIAEQNVNDKSGKASQSVVSLSPLSSDPNPEDECSMKEDDHKNLSTPSSQETAQEYSWMNMVFDMANKAKDFFVEWSDGENFVVRLGRSRLERGLNHSAQKLALTKEQKEKITECVRLKFTIKNTLSALCDAWPDKKFEYGRVHMAFQKAKEETRKTTLKLSGFSEAADTLKLLQDKAEENPGWYFGNETDNQRRLTCISWMSPFQRALCLRYDETAEAYSWVLKHLMAADNNRPPRIFMTDQDTGMESAFNSAMADGRQANRSWHILFSVSDQKKIKKNVERHATAANKKEAKKRFERAQSAPNLLKKDLNSHSTLDQVFILTEERKVSENHNHEELLYKRQYKPTAMTNVALAEFSEAHRENSKFLGGFARNRMLFEMIDSLPLQVFSIELDDVELTLFLKNCTYRAMYEVGELADSDDGDGGKAGEHDLEEDDDGAERATHREFRQLGYSHILSKLGRDNVSAVYSVKLS